MKDFQRARGRLANLPFAARVVYTVFLVFTLAGLALTVWLVHEMVGLDLADADAYYAGEVAASAAQPAPTGGPVMDLPPEVDAPPAEEPMPLRKLLEVTHFHLFSMPIYLLVVSHLFMLGTMGERAKVAWVGAGTLGVAAHIAAPWLAREGGGAWFYATTGMLLGASFVVMGVAALWDMWLRD